MEVIRDGKTEAFRVIRDGLLILARGWNASPMDISRLMRGPNGHLGAYRLTQMPCGHYPKQCP
jgi:hypothetical protein